MTGADGAAVFVSAAAGAAVGAAVLVSVGATLILLSSAVQTTRNTHRMNERTKHKARKSGKARQTRKRDENRVCCSDHVLFRRKRKAYDNTGKQTNDTWNMTVIKPTTKSESKTLSNQFERLSHTNNNNQSTYSIYHFFLPQNKP